MANSFSLRRAPPRATSAWPDSGYSFVQRVGRCLLGFQQRRRSRHRGASAKGHERKLAIAAKLSLFDHLVGGGWHATAGLPDQRPIGGEIDQRRENAAMGETALDADHPFLAPFRTDLN